MYKTRMRTLRSRKKASRLLDQDLPGSSSSHGFAGAAIGPPDLDLYSGFGLRGAEAKPAGGFRLTEISRAGGDFTGLPRNSCSLHCDPGANRRSVTLFTLEPYFQKSVASLWPGRLGESHHGCIVDGEDQFGASVPIQISSGDGGCGTGNSDAAVFRPGRKKVPLAISMQ